MKKGVSVTENDNIEEEIKKDYANMKYGGKIPIIVGVTGHRNIAREDKAELKRRVIDSLVEIKELCKDEKGGEDTPVVMLNAFAQGADMLCAEAAFELGIDVYALLPRKAEKYIESFDDPVDKAKLFDYLAKTKRTIIAPDIEKNKQWLKDNIASMNDDSYEYRQLGIYMANNSHILLALWDGNPPDPERPFGCGAVEVINFALQHNYLNKDHLFKPATINDSAVVWIKARRQDASKTEITKQWLIRNLEAGKVETDENQKGKKKKKDTKLEVTKREGTNQEEEKKKKTQPEYIPSDEPPQYLIDIIKKTIRYNNNNVDVSIEKTYLWTGLNDLDEYRKTIVYHHEKSNKLSCDKNQKMYNRFILAIAIAGTAVALFFLLYDDMSLPYLIFPCSAAVGVVLGLMYFGRKKAYHTGYIDYRAFSEAMRIQFYMSMCLKEKEIVSNVSDLYSWAQKVDSVWIDKAVRAIAVISNIAEAQPDTTKVLETWIGGINSNSGQLAYHTNKKGYNKKRADKYKLASKITRISAIVMYLIIFAIEIIACILKARNVDWFWEHNIFAKVSWRNFCAIILGIVTAFSLLFSSYWGKLPFDRKYEDNVKMCKFFSSACARWNEAKSHPDVEIELFVKEIAREEIVENGVWYSYVKDNGLEINI